MVLTEHDAFGALSFLTGSRHAVSAVATRDTAVWVLRRSDFADLLKRAPELARRLRMFLQSEQISDYLQEKHHFDPATASRWVADAVRHLDAGRVVPPAERLSREIRAIKGAPLAIWLGILLDGVPESLVIGAGLVHPDISLALVAGVFLSNYPEALFSSLGMRRQGMSQLRVVLMWSSIMISTALGAALGSLVLVDAGGLTFAFVEGLAAGAMLTMIAQTMLPEAYIKGGSIIGITTLLGFLAALFFKSL
jgi:zinc transporter ZupT